MRLGLLAFRGVANLTQSFNLLLIMDFAAFFDCGCQGSRLYDKNRAYWGKRFDGWQVKIVGTLLALATHGHVLPDLFASIPFKMNRIGVSKP
jgi:hypothetical protein